MKKYVIIGYVFGIGGWQTYMNNKLLLMQENGWEPYALSNGILFDDKNYLPGLEKYQPNRFFEFSMFPYPSDLPTRRLEELRARVSRIIDYHEGDEIIFETTKLEMFLWAEYLAQAFGGRSICVEVSNRFARYGRPMLDFFYFKEQRTELLMMLKTGLHELFEGYREYPRVIDDNVGALTESEYADDGKDYRSLLNVDQSDYVIGTVGWLDKGYYSVLMDEVVRFAQANKDKKVQFIVVGKSSTGAVEQQYRAKAAQADNLRLDILGPIAPVPSNLVSLFDVSVASYGCATITDKIGVKTIAMHDPDPIPLGILSYTITKGPFNTRVNEDKTICDMLTDILVNRICDRMVYTPYKSRGVEDQKKLHLKKLNDMPEKIEYYDISGLHNPGADLKYRVWLLIYRFLGSRATDEILRKRAENRVKTRQGE